MCKSALHGFLADLPKSEHHIHLEGALAPSLLFRLAAKNKIDLPTNDPAFASPEALTNRYTNFASLDDFLGYYYIGMSALTTPEDFEALATDYFEYAAKDAVMHADVFFDPQAHLSRGVSYETVLSGFTAAREKAEKTLNITSTLICCFLRHLPVPESVETFHLSAVQASFASGAVAGIGIDSSEVPFPPHLFTPLYSEAAKLGLRLTAHAGEEAGPEYIASALKDLQVTRIDHGVSLARDPELMARVAAAGTLLTVCPMSNVFLKCVKSVAEVPIRKFLDAGVKFSLNSDDPAYFGGNYIGANYCAVQEAFGLTVKEWEGIALAGVRGSWCRDVRREEMVQRVVRFVAQHASSTS
nr:hypothetical protein B0A51_15149 [Rachicladosporium sp. CCFEE 5018]